MAAPELVHMPALARPDFDMFAAFVVTYNMHCLDRRR